ncbi:hypothetical protein [Pseudomonas sp. TCU-HL1]|uniref:hypothetical protein n=1 Tax=Pseudomonas sp. TCU-HL1 TaxID=1856685 RepID=UPI0039C8C643
MSKLPLAFAHESGDGKEQRAVLQVHALLNAPGKKAIMLTVSYAPVQHSPAHSHPGSVFAYVEEG